MPSNQLLQRARLRSSHVHGSGGGSGKLQNSLEPARLIHHFLNNPPVGFTAHSIETSTGIVPAFSTPYNLQTTIDEGNGDLMDRLRSSKLMAKFLTFKTLFVGTTVTEYSVFPRGQSSVEVSRRLFHLMKQTDSQLVIVKDLPVASPMLTEEENAATDNIAAVLEEFGYHSVSGMALAYVPIDFSSVEEYLSRLSKSRRKDLRRKNKAKANLRIEELNTGNWQLHDERMIDRLYDLYLQVFNQSKYHFDLLSKSFFRAALTDASSNGVVFLYHQKPVEQTTSDNASESASKERVSSENAERPEVSYENIIGFNLSYVHDDRLIDKYIGLQYPQAHQHSLYFVSWLYNLEFAVRNKLKVYVAGWTDPEVKKSLGASFTFTRHCVYVRNRTLNWFLSKFKKVFEGDSTWAKRESVAEAVE